MALKHFSFYLGLILTSCLAIWTTLLIFPTQKLINVQTDLSPDGYMEDVVATIMDKEGKVKMKVVTPRMIHYYKDDVSELTTPEITIYRNSTYPWFVTAKNARASHGVDQVDLWNDVIIRHAADEKSPETLINTVTLTVFPHKQTAQTEAEITLKQPRLNIKAIGMFADMNTSEVKLLSQARGEYDPNP